MTHVIRIVKKDLYVEKPSYTPEFRKEFNRWPKSIRTTSGLIEGKTLILPQSYAEKGINLKETACIILSENILKHEVEVLTFQRPTTPWQYGFLYFHYEESSFPIHLNYTQNDSYIGLPIRQDHKIGELNNQKPLVYKLNGKIDGERRQRLFRETTLHINYLGEANNITFSPNVTAEVDLNLSIAKTIDERKLLV